MWVAKFTLESMDIEDTVLELYVRKHKVIATGYPLSFYHEKGKYLFTTAGFLKGPENNIKSCLEDFKKDKRVRNLEVKGDLITIQFEGNKQTKEFYDPHFIFVSPAAINSDGTEIWEVGCWERERLSNLITQLKKKHKIKLLSLNNKKINYLTLVQAIPTLTAKQKRALVLAIDNGYYESPRKVELKELARMMNVSFSTYKQHLRRTEEKFFEGVRTAI